MGRRMVTLKWILGTVECEGVDWINLAQYKVQWRAAVNTVLNLRFP
jgi:hypothetical protein